MTSAYASPASSFADSIERAAAGARFSSVGRQLLGPRLPVAIDWNDPPPELWYAAYVAGKTLLNVVEAHGGVPRGVLGVLGVNVYVFCKPGGVLFGDVCLNPYAVLHMNQLERVVTSAFVHRDLFHLLNNMTGLVEDGSYVESRDGVGCFLAQTALLLVLSQGALVTLSWAERKLTGRGGSRGASGWIDDALGGLTTTTTTTTRRSGGGGAETLPFYSSGVVGFSGVNYALKVVASHRRPLGSRVLLLGVLPVPARYSFWCELALNTLLMPSSGTFAAHFAGCVAGLVSVYVPLLAGVGKIGTGRFGRGGRGAIPGTGQRLGGRYLRGDAPRDSRETRGAATAQGLGHSMTSRGAPGGGRRLGGGGGGGGPGGARKGVNALTRLLRRLVLAPAKAIRNAVDEGGPLVTHAGFAFACLALQRAMRANAPGGLLEKGVSPIARTLRFNL